LLIGLEKNKGDQIALIFLSSNAVIGPSTIGVNPFNQ
jgi:hypothetical protein